MRFPLPPDIDFHTHRQDATPGTAIVALPLETLLHPERFKPHPQGLYAVGIHPWWIHDHAFTQLWEGMQAIALHPEVVMVGECGWDAFYAPPLGHPAADVPPNEADFTQTDVFMRQAYWAKSKGLPMTLHCVRAFHLLLAAHRRVQPSAPWTVHGFRGKPALAAQLVAAGIHLSFGAHFQQEAWDITPPEMRHRETD